MAGLAGGWVRETVPLPQLEGYGELALNYGSFHDLHSAGHSLSSLLKALLKGGRVFLGDLFCCLNYEAQVVELYQGDVLLGSYATSFEKTADAEHTRCPESLYDWNEKKRHECQGVFRCVKQSAFSKNGGKYIRLPEAYAQTAKYTASSFVWEIASPMNPTSALMSQPDGAGQVLAGFQEPASLGMREFQVFTVTSDIEEHETRTGKYLSWLWVFPFESAAVQWNDYQVKVIPRDINVWFHGFS